MESSKHSEALDEGLSLNLTGKIFLASLGAWMVGKYVNTKIRGSRDEVSAVSNALMASKRFQEELRKPGATVQSVMDKLHVKQMSASEFERVFGIKWPL
jgi:hypothetical protein